MKFNAICMIIACLILFTAQALVTLGLTGPKSAPANDIHRSE